MLAPPASNAVIVRLCGLGILVKRKRSGEVVHVVRLHSSRPDGLPADASLPSSVGVSLSCQLQTHPDAKWRPWTVCCGPALRMLSQPASSAGRVKLLQMCWVPPVCTLVEHYRGITLTCADVLSTIGNVGAARDEAEDPLDVLAEHYALESVAAWADDVEAVVGGGGWEAGEVRPLYEANAALGGAEEVAAAWWAELATSIRDGHPTYLLCERLEESYRKRATANGNSYHHCMLIVGFEAPGGPGGEPRSSERRGPGEPRLLLKDPCCAEPERLIEGSLVGPWEELGASSRRSKAGAAAARVVLRTYCTNGRAVDSRFRVKGSVRFARASEAQVAERLAERQRQHDARVVIAAEAAQVSAAGAAKALAAGTA